MNEVEIKKIAVKEYPVCRKKDIDGDWYEVYKEQRDAFTYGMKKAFDLGAVSKCTCLQDCDNCGAKNVQFISTGSEVCSKCFC